MELASFPQANQVLGKPADMTHEQCEAASVYQGVQTDDVPVVISCWKCTAEELAEINKTGRVWLVVAGQTMPPARLLGVSPFIG